mgnify:CR=1 FL=1
MAEWQCHYEEPTTYDYLKVIAEHFSGGPVGLDTLAAARDTTIGGFPAVSGVAQR